MNGGGESCSRRMKRRGSVAKRDGRTEGCAVATQRDTKTELRAAKEGSKRRQKEEVKREVRERGFRSSNLPDLYVLSLPLSFSPHSRIYRLRAGRPSPLERSNERGDGGGRRQSESERDAGIARGIVRATRTAEGPSPRGLERSSSASANRAAPFARVSQSSGDASITRLLSGGKKK